MPEMMMPGAPGFGPPEGVTPDEYEEWLRRMRFGNRGFGGQNVEAAGGATVQTGAPSLGGMPRPPQGIPNPKIVSSFMARMATPEPSLTGTYTEGIKEKIGKEAPETLAEYNKVYDPRYFDLPQDELARQKIGEAEKAEFEKGEKSRETAYKMGDVEARRMATMAEMATAAARLAEAGALDEGQLKLIGESLSQEMTGQRGERPPAAPTAAPKEGMRVPIKGGGYKVFRGGRWVIEGK